MKNSRSPAGSRQQLGESAVLERTLACTLVVPAHNEASRIGPCLREVGRAFLPPGVHWREWIICDDASVDGTVDEARRAAAAVGFHRLRIMERACRAGKSGVLQGAHAYLLASASPDEVVVLLDADVKPDVETFTELLRPFLDDPDLSVVWGDDRATPTHWRQGPATFQMYLKSAIGQAESQGAVRASGRLCAYRLGSLRDFSWAAHSVADDVQLAWFAATHRLSVRSAWRATVQVTPADTFKDFYVQTYRPRFRKWAPGVEVAGWAQGHPFAGPTRRAVIRGVARAAAGDPLRGLSYLVYRVLAAGIRRISPNAAATIAAEARSTKVPWRESAGAAVTPGGQHHLDGTEPVGLMSSGLTSSDET